MAAISANPNEDACVGSAKRGFAKEADVQGTSRNGAAQESNLPSLGLPDLTGFEVRDLGNRLMLSSRLGLF
jgi:hypothetical protein